MSHLFLIVSMTIDDFTLNMFFLLLLFFFFVFFFIKILADYLVYGVVNPLPDLFKPVKDHWLWDLDFE